MGMEKLLNQQRLLIEQAQCWDASDIRQLYEKLSDIAARIAALWVPEGLSHE